MPASAGKENHDHRMQVAPLNFFGNFPKTTFQDYYENCTDYYKLFFLVTFTPLRQPLSD